MPYTELLHDPSSLERGDELLELMQDGLSRFFDLEREARLDNPNFEATADRLVTDVINDGNTVNASMFENLGRQLVRTKLAQVAFDVNQRGTSMRSLNHAAEAHAPGEAFIAAHVGKPIAVERVERNTPGSAIERHDPHIFRSRFPYRIGGFVFPSMYAMSGMPWLNVSKSPDPANNQAAKWVIRPLYGKHPVVRIAIGE
jgi:hypothetical protein